jgi:hypothetical protein
VTILAGGDSATPKPAQYFGRKVWGVYVAGDTFRVWTKQEVAELARYGVEGVMPIVVPPQNEAWWELNAGYAVLEHLVREAKAWGVPAGSPLCLDVEQHQADAMPAKQDVAHAWAVATRAHGYRTWTYSGRDYLLSDHYGFLWLAEWPEPTLTDPQLSKPYNAWQYATRPGDGIDLDIFEAGRDYMTPNLDVVVLEAPGVKSHSEQVASSSEGQPDSAEGHLSPGSAAPATEAGGASDTPTPPANLLGL